MGIDLIADIQPKNGGSFPTHSDIYGKGGFQSRADAADRDSIPALNRVQGMLVYLRDTGSTYVLGVGLTNGDWVLQTTHDVAPFIVWDSDLPTGSGTVNSWAEVEAFINEVTGVLFLSCSVYVVGFSAVVPSSANTECNGLVTFRSTSTYGVFLGIADGGRLRNIQGSDGVLIYGAPTAVSPLVFDFPNNGIFFSGGYTGGLQLFGSGTPVPLVSVLDSVTFHFAGNAVLDNSLFPTRPIVDVAASKSFNIVYEDNPGANFIGANGPMLPDLVSGAVSSSLSVYLGGARSFTAQALFLGTVTEIRTQLARAQKPSSGNTAGRPPLPFVGEMYFDTTLGTTLWWNGSAWGAQSGASSVGGAGQVQTSDGAGGFTAPANVLAGSGFVSAGATPATTGALRLANGAGASAINARNGLNNADITMCELTSGNLATFGGDINLTKVSTSAYILALSSVIFNISSGERLSIDASFIYASRAIIGGATSPFGMHGTVISAMIDADYAVPANEYCYQEQVVPPSLTLTVGRKFKYPTPAVESFSYTKEFINTASGAQTITLTRADGAGDTVDILTATKATVRVRPGGVYLVGTAIAAP